MNLNQNCRDFRERLVEALSGAPRPTELRTLSWHEHLLGCADCRSLLEREEALEVLLATLPEPKLPPELVQRVVYRLGLSGLATELSTPLDSLLDLGLASTDVPAGLTERIRAGLAAERSLDALLDLDPTVEIPAGLSRRVLAGLGRTNERRIPRLRVLSKMPRYAAAAAVLLGLLSAPWWANDEPQVASPDPHGIAQTQDDVDPDLLAFLEVLENDQLWTENATGSSALIEESDYHLWLEGSVDPGDEILLGFLPADTDGDTEPSDG